MLVRAIDLNAVGHITVLALYGRQLSCVLEKYKVWPVNLTNCQAVQCVQCTVMQY